LDRRLGEGYRAGLDVVAKREILLLSEIIPRPLSL
jgi:hypothetical protein